MREVQESSASRAEMPRLRIAAAMRVALQRQIASLMLPLLHGVGGSARFARVGDSG
jgi:hypothetical protein